jgi:hypothetical protein
MLVRRDVLPKEPAGCGREGRGGKKEERAAKLKALKETRRY